MISKNKFVLFLTAAIVAIQSASADAVSDNITTAIGYIGYILSGVANALYTGFVTPLGTWITLAVLGVIFMLVFGVGKWVVRFLDSMLSNMKYGGK